MIDTAKAKSAQHVVPSSEMTAQVELALSKSRQTQRPFFVVLIQIDNLAAFQRRRSAPETHLLLRELHAGVRKAVHPSQPVVMVRDGVGVVFDAGEPGQVDLISRRLVSLCQTVIRKGGYNDLNAKWSDLLYQFLVPGGGAVMVARAGWAIYPRDGESASDILNRAWAHLRQEQAR